MVESAHTRIANQILLVLVPVLGCGGTDFTSAGPVGDGLGGAASITTKTAPIAIATGGNPNQESTPSSGGSSTEGTTSVAAGSSECGELRADPDAYDVELCILGGTFTMGSSNANLGSGHADHTPPHPVTLTSYAIDAFEVTVARYRACVVAGRCETPNTDVTRNCSYTAQPGASDALPISCVTPTQAEVFCQWDGRRRLPTEAEWERAARGTDERVFPWGSSFACDRAVAAANGSCASTHRGFANVGSSPLGDSPDGAHDMAGNVAEWVSDFASSYPTSNVTNPTGPATGVSRILRGGSFTNNAPDIQAFVRATASATTIGAFGMRCARSAGI